MDRNERKLDAGRIKALLGAGLMAALLLALVPAKEAHAQGVVIIGGSTHHHHSDGYYVPGHYESRTESVLVESAHYEKQWVEPMYKTVKLEGGVKVKVLVRDGYWQDVYVPERYETRVVQFWVPGYYVGRSHRSPSFSVGLGFRF